MNKKQLIELLDETVSEDWKAYKSILKDEKGYKNKKEYKDDSYSFGADDSYDSLNWSAGYISALKHIINNTK